MEASNILWASILIGQQQYCVSPTAYTTLKKRGGGGSCKFVLSLIGVFLCFCFLSKDQLHYSRSRLWEPVHIKTQVQGRENTRHTLWA